MERSNDVLAPTPEYPTPEYVRMMFNGVSIGAWKCEREGLAVYGDTQAEATREWLDAYKHLYLLK